MYVGRVMVKGAGGLGAWEQQTRELRDGWQEGREEGATRM